MTNPSIERQLERIDKIHDRLHRVLLDETLTDMEELVAELGSRLTTVITEIEQADQAGEGARLLGCLLERQHDLTRMLDARLKSTSVKLVGARKNSMVNRKYKFSAARTNAELIKSMDLTG